MQIHVAEPDIIVPPLIKIVNGHLPLVYQREVLVPLFDGQLRNPAERLEWSEAQISDRDRILRALNKTAEERADKQKEDQRKEFKAFYPRDAQRDHATRRSLKPSR